MSAPQQLQDSGLAHRLPHLLAGLAASVAFLGVLAAVPVVGRARIRDRIAMLAPSAFQAKWQGEAVQREVLRHQNILPLYGSSELVVPMDNRAAEFFAGAPTGFVVSPVGDVGSPPLALALRIASMGRELRGRRLVISASATWFLRDHSAGDRLAFEGNYSDLQAGDVLLGGELPDSLKRDLASRLLRYPALLSTDALLHTVAGCLSRSCAYAPLLPVLRPLWELRSLPLRARDYLAAAWYTPAAPERASSQARGAPDWARLEMVADSIWRIRSANNRFGILNSLWDRTGSNPAARAGSRNDSGFVAAFGSAPRWKDFRLLLSTLTALGARALVLDTPLKGVYFDHVGVSSAARTRFYDKFESETAPYGFPTRNFRERDGDPYFLSEPGSHLSPKGWLVYDRTIDAFYHNAIQ